MSVSATKNRDILVINVSDRFDFSSHEQFRSSYHEQELSQLQVIIDLSSTTHIDSAALGMMLVLRERIGKGNHSVSITGANPQVKEILAVSRFDKLFDVA